MTLLHRAAAASRPRLAASVGIVLATCVWVLPGSSAAAARVEPLAAAPVPDDSAWVWPVSGGFRLEREYITPAHEYAAGHRGLDVRPATDARLVAPADGVVAFAGWVADRPLITLAHSDGLVTTLEPVTALVTAGDAVRRGDTLAVLASGGHAAEGTLHIGLRRDGEYINPLSLLGGVPRAVLLPCC